MKKRDIIIIGAVLALALAGMAAVRLLSPNGAADYVRIYVGDSLYRQVSLAVDQVITIDQGSGVVNHIEIKDGAVRMSDSTCPDKQCIDQGAITGENYEQRLLRNWIICLPNQVTVELAVENEGS